MSLISFSIRPNVCASRWGFSALKASSLTAPQSNLAVKKKISKTQGHTDPLPSAYRWVSSKNREDQTSLSKAGRPTPPESKRSRKDSSRRTSWKSFQETLRGNAPIQEVLSLIDPIYLRDACTCPMCVDQSTQQRNFRTSQIPTDIKVQSIDSPEPSIARVHWTNDIASMPKSHVSEYSMHYLRSILDRSPNREQVEWDRSLYVADRNNWIDYDSFMTSDTGLKQAVTQLSRYGLVFITQIPTDPSPNQASSKEISAVSDIATRIGPLYNSHYGLTWDVKSIPNAANVAYTDVDLGFHMDLLYKRDPPYIQLLHCLRNSRSGGESLFVDTYKAARRLWEQADGDGKQHFQVLASHPMAFEYVNDGQSFRRSRHTFSLVDRTKSKSKSKSRSRPPGSSSHAPPAATTPTPSSAPDTAMPDLQGVYYSPPFQGPLPKTYSLRHDQPGPRRPWTTQPLVRALAAFEAELQRDDMVLEVKLEPGTCAVFENLRVAHARRAFAQAEGGGGGVRWLRGAYVGRDDYFSKLSALGLFG